MVAFSSSPNLIFNAVVNKEEKVTAVLSALADPTRRRIMERLYGRGETRATALAVPFRISMPAISRHLRVLESARLIERRRVGRLHLIRARRAGLEEVRRWMTHYAAAWDSALDALDDLMRKDIAMGEKR
jgi:DNA-binding transcriptional ArsR family regulator